MKTSKKFNLSTLLPLLADAQKKAITYKEFKRIFKANCKEANYNFKQAKEYLATHKFNF